MFKYCAGISILIALFGGCNTDVDLPNIVVLGHGGSGFVSVHNPQPANTKRSIEKAIFVYGADGVEVDIQMTADYNLVVYHDQRLETSTNGIGFVSEQTSNELKHIVYRSQIDQTHKDSLLFLSDLLSILAKSNRPLKLSLNIHPQYEVADFEKYMGMFSQALILQINGYSGLMHLMIESPDRAFFPSLKYNLTGVLGIDLYYDAKANEDNINFAKSENLQGLVSNYLNEDTASMKRAKEAGLVMSLYGLKLKSDIKKALELHPDMVQTDNIPMTMDFLKN